MDLCFSNLLVWGEVGSEAVKVSLSALIGKRVKISHVYLGNLRYVNGKIKQFGN